MNNFWMSQVLMSTDGTYSFVMTNSLMLSKQLILTNIVPNIAKKSSHGQKMRLPPTKISLPVKNVLFLLATQINEQNVRKLF
jgi:hypothetical protein